MFRIFSKKNGKAHPKPRGLLPSTDQALADTAIKLALEACDNHLMLTRSAKGAALRMRTALDDLVLEPYPVKK